MLLESKGILELAVVGKELERLYCTTLGTPRNYHGVGEKIIKYVTNK